MRMLLVEDDPVSARSVVKMLRDGGHSCDIINCPQEYRNDLVYSSNYSHYDMILLDIHLGDDDNGFDILLKLRNAKITVPVLITSCISSVSHKTRGLKLGADDYMVKPLPKSELLARIHAVMRRTIGHPESSNEFGNFKINFDRRTLTVKKDGCEHDIKLTNKEYSMLELMAMRQGTVISKEMFLNHLYSGSDEPSDSKIIDVFACKLRQKLTEVNDGKNHIKTIWGRGYMLAKIPEESNDQQNIKRTIENVDLVVFNKLLEEKNIDINTTDYNGNTILMDIINRMAVVTNNNKEERYYGMVNLLLNNKRLNINIQNKRNGNTALHIGAILSNERLVEKLLKSEDINFSIRNNEGETAEEFARSKGVKHIAEMIACKSKEIRKVVAPGG
ncbi:winged helix-turn-helix domain-containing protein [Candidatus Mesenet endosymbiont of Agriotes lineatus]|uniref:winged helix-turn-helix domain-containing protein n=1 Tax=Candidatus Mesenet endosymbiont of Agriotes lineatus TaxID=3077948 RepID=UPI0030CBB848